MLSGLRGIRAAKPQSPGLAREIRTDREIESLVAWADARGALWAKTSAPKTDELTGGEHLVEIDERSGIVFKSTHPGKFGYSADVELVHPRGWKAKPRNVLTLRNGDLMPFDVVIVRPSEHLKSRLGF